MSARWPDLWAEAKRADMRAVAERLGAKLKRDGVDWVGPCPAGCAKLDGFVVTPSKGLFLCRPSGATGDAVDMTMHVKGGDKAQALAFVTGRAPPRPINRVPADAATRAKSLRDRAAIDAIVKRAVPIAGTHAEAYLCERGLTPQRRLTADLMFVADLEYWAGGPQPIAVLPAMVAIIRDVAGGRIGIHQTYLDPNEPRKWTPPSDEESAKKIRGEAKGGLIRLGIVGEKIAIGEGVETTLAYHALRGSPDLSIACGVSLSVMAGRCTGTIPHPTLTAPNGKPTRIANGEPDIAKPGLILPAGVRELILLGDGDSEPCQTRLKILAAGRRAAAGGLNVNVHFAPAGKDWANVHIRWRSRGDPPLDVLAALRAAKPDLLRVLAARKAAKAALDTEPPPDCPEQRWAAARRGLEHFVRDGWTDQAALIGWTAGELYRVPPVWSRVHLTGAALMIGDRRVVAITEASIAIETLFGSLLKFRRIGREHLA
jgi:hypothetical protein